jgi:predicted dehydrogenase
MSLTIALLGCGRWGRLILRDLISLGARVHVVVPSEENRLVAISLGAAGAWPLANKIPEPVDGYVVATPTASHAAVIEELLPTQKPIFVEKPMTNDVVSARRIAAAAGGRVFVMDKWRYHPGVEELARAAKSGELGRVLAIRSYRLGWENPHSDVDAAWILLPHELAIAYHVLGHLPQARAAWSPTPGRPHTDLVGVLADVPAGPQVTVEIATSHPVTKRSVVVVGTRGAAQLGDSYDEGIMLADGVPGEKAGKPYTRPVGKDMPLLRELRAFLEHLRGGPPPMSSAAEGLLVVERIAALRALAGLDAKAS